MLANSLVKDFQVRLGNKFILQKVREEFKEYFDAENGGTYASIIDFINNTIVSADVLGLEIPSTVEQSSRRGETLRSSNGSLSNARKKSRTASLSFSCKRTYLNYMMLYRNIEEFRDGDSPDAEDGYYDDIYLDMLDVNGNIVYSFIYRQVQVNKLSQISLSKNDRSISSNQFTMDITFNKIDFKSHVNQLKSDLNSTYRHDNV